MTSPTTSVADPFDAGPYARLQAALQLTRPGAPRVVRRALVVAAVAWLPLLVLAAAQGLLLRANPRESLLLDIAAYSRFLVALPLLVVAESVCLPKLGLIARHFGDAGLVGDAERSRYDALIDSSRGLLDHRGMEVGLVLGALVTTLGLGSILYPPTVSTWAVPLSDGVGAPSLAGWWRALVSQPLFLVFTFAWLWRTLVWGRFLWGISRLDLRLIPSHPDLSGGLRFVAVSLRAFSVVALALAVNMAGTVGEMIVVDQRAPTEFQFLVAGLLAFVLLIFAGPLLLLARPLLRARIRGIFAYGELAGALGRRFETKWLSAGDAIDAEALSAPDFSATTDLFSVAANVRAMQVVPFDLKALLPLVLATLLPFVPLVFTFVSVDTVLSFVAKLVL
jgi:hypothetical protein